MEQSIWRVPIEKKQMEKDRFLTTMWYARYFLSLNFDYFLITDYNIVRRGS